MKCPHKYAQTMRSRRRKRIRDKVRGSAQRPRLSFFKSSRHVYAQVVDDDQGKTLAHVHSFTASKNKDGKLQRAGTDTCKTLGKILADHCKASGIEQVVFDRGGFPYHGRVQAFAEGAREGGLVF